MSAPARWDQMRERGSLFWLVLLLSVSRLLGRGVARFVLVFVVGYFLLAGRQAYRASQNFLSRALGRPVRLADSYRHFYAFAATALDRFFLLGGKADQLDIDVRRPPEVEALAAAGGCLIMVSHLGSFDVMRVRGLTAHALPLKILLDRAQNRVFTALLERLNPDFARTVIDASDRGPTLVLKLREALAQKATVCVMADRVREGERALPVGFMGGTAQLPAGPWLLAAALQVPVILAFGLYRGGARYELHFELFAERIDAPRARREAALQEYAQRYAERLEHQARAAPYNWFNFYDFWIDGAAQRL
jgi:predicted LPLAT superfamily acyltransferase